MWMKFDASLSTLSWPKKYLNKGVLVSTDRLIAFRATIGNTVSWNIRPKLGFFYVLLTSKGENIAFPPPSPPCNVVPLLELPTENNKHPNFEWRGQGKGVDSFVLWSYPIREQSLNNFVADCRSIHTQCCYTGASSSAVLGACKMQQRITSSHLEMLFICTLKWSLKVRTDSVCAK